MNDSSDIKRALDVFFADLSERFDTNTKRLNYLHRVFKSVGNSRSRTWRSLLFELKKTTDIYFFFIYLPLLM